MRVLFYAALARRELFETVEFYHQDILALRELGHEVRLASHPREIMGAWDLAWVWWQTSGAPAVIASRVLGRPSVLVSALSHQDRTASGMPSKSPHARLAAVLALKSADLVLATSDDTRLGLARYRLQNLRTASLGVDTRTYAPGGPRQGSYVLTISHLTADNVRRKRILDVVRAVAGIPEQHARIIGRHGDGVAVVQREIQRLGVAHRVELSGEVSASVKRRFLREAAVYIQPTDYEAFGMAIAEAMASGTPVISHAVGNVPALVGDTGRLLPPGAGPEALREALAALLTDPQLDRRGTLARKRIEQKFSRAHRAEGVRAALETVIAMRRKRGIVDRRAEE